MKEEHQDLLIKSCAVLAGAAVLKALEKGYEHQWEEPPPNAAVDRDPDWKKVCLWSVASGLTVALMKTGVARTGARYLK